MSEKQPATLPGHLYVVATPIGNLGDISRRAIDVISASNILACEDTRITKKLLDLLSIPSVQMLSYRDENEIAQTENVLRLLREGKTVSLLSDAGTPTISDPGFRIVRACRKEGIPVVPVPGPCAYIVALSASGLPSDRVLFKGFLPPKSAARIRFFEEYKDFEGALALYESSHRIEKFMAELVDVLGPDRTICIAREITKLHETFLVGKIGSLMDDFKLRSKKGEFVILIAPKDFEL